MRYYYLESNYYIFPLTNYFYASSLTTVGIGTTSMLRVVFLITRWRLCNVLWWSSEIKVIVSVQQNQRLLLFRSDNIMSSDLLFSRQRNAANTRHHDHAPINVPIRFGSKKPNQKQNKIKQIQHNIYRNIYNVTFTDFERNQQREIVFFGSIFEDLLFRNTFP